MVINLKSVNAKCYYCWCIKNISMYSGYSINGRPLSEYYALNGRTKIC
jgi:hypothetical protein